MNKKPNGLMTPRSKGRLSVFNSGVYDGDRELVVACGYDDTNYKFGYFICYEHVEGSPDAPVYVYTDVQSFYPKENEHTYQRVLDEFKSKLEECSAPRVKP